MPTPLHWSHLSSCCPCCDQEPVGLLPTGYGLARCLLVSIWYLEQAPNHLRTVHRSGACTIGSVQSYRYGFEPRTFGSSELHFDYSAAAPSRPRDSEWSAEYKPQSGRGRLGDSTANAHFNSLFVSVTCAILALLLPAPHHKTPTLSTRLPSSGPPPTQGTKVPGGGGAGRREDSPQAPIGLGAAGSHASLTT